MKDIIERESQGSQTEDAELIDAMSKRIAEAGRKMREFNTVVDCNFGSDPTILSNQEFEIMKECALSIGDYLEAIVKLNFQAYLLPGCGMLGLHNISIYDREFFRIIAKTLKEPTAAGLLEGVVTYHSIGRVYKELLLTNNDTIVFVQEAFMGTLQYLRGSRFTPGQLPSVCSQGLVRGVCVNDLGYIEYPRLPF